jgi:hypothetical protein
MAGWGQVGHGAASGRTARSPSCAAAGPYSAAGMPCVGARSHRANRRHPPRVRMQGRMPPPAPSGADAGQDAAAGLHGHDRRWTSRRRIYRLPGTIPPTSPPPEMRNRTYLVSETSVDGTEEDGCTYKRLHMQDLGRRQAQSRFNGPRLPLPPLAPGRR